MARVIDVAPRPGRRLLGVDQAAVEQVLHLGVVARQLHELILPQPIDAAVASPQTGVSALEGEQGGKGRADDVGIALRRNLADFAVGRGDAVLEPGLEVAGGRLDADRPELIDDAGAGDLSGIVAAHPVGDREHAARHVQIVAVLVERADATCVGCTMTVDVEHRPIYKSQPWAAHLARNPRRPVRREWRGWRFNICAEGKGLASLAGKATLLNQRRADKATLPNSKARRHRGRQINDNTYLQNSTRVKQQRAQTLPWASLLGLVHEKVGFSHQISC